jgi:hypothetical protein
LGHARIIDLKAEPEIIQRLRDLDYDARIERGMIISLEGFDWNCPQHITPRFTEAEVREQIAPLLSRLKSAEAQLERSCFGGGSVQSLGQGPLELVVTGVRQLTPRIRLYELEDPEGKDLPPAAPGSHLTVPVHLPDGSETVRSYSIASDPARRDVYEIAVLRDDNGRGGSAAVHRDYVVGLRLRCGAPKNAFPLHEDDSPAILIAGGVGITPIRAMAYELARSGREFRLHFAARSAREAAFRSELAETLRDRVTFYFESEILDVDRVLDEAGVQGMVYVCGPEGLIQAVVSRGRERGWPEQRVRYERFAALASSGRNESFELVLRKSKRRVPVAPGESALDALECAGVPVVSSCRTGTCGTCVVRVLSGEPEHRDSVLSPEERAAGRFTTCVSRSRSPELDLDL